MWWIDLVDTYLFWAVLVLWIAVVGFAVIMAMTQEGR